MLSLTSTLWFIFLLAGVTVRCMPKDGPYHPDNRPFCKEYWTACGKPCTSSSLTMYPDGQDPCGPGDCCPVGQVKTYCACDDVKYRIKCNSLLSQCGSMHCPEPFPIDLSHYTSAYVGLSASSCFTTPMVIHVSMILTRLVGDAPQARGRLGAFGLAATWLAFLFSIGYKLVLMVSSALQAKLASWGLATTDVILSSAAVPTIHRRRRRRILRVLVGTASIVRQPPVHRRIVQVGHRRAVVVVVMVGDGEVEADLDPSVNKSGIGGGEHEATQSINKNCDAIQQHRKGSKLPTNSRIVFVGPSLLLTHTPFLLNKEDEIFRNPEKCREITSCNISLAPAVPHLLHNFKCLLYLSKQLQRL